jgi:hypothetical protein
MIKYPNPIWWDKWLEKNYRKQKKLLRKAKNEHNVVQTKEAKGR